MRIDNTTNTAAAETTKKSKLNFSFKRKNKMNKSSVMVISFILIFVLIIIYILNLEEQKQDVNENVEFNEVSQFDMSKINNINENSQQQLSENKIEMQQYNSEFDMSKINSLIQQKQVEQEQTELIETTIDNRLNDYQKIIKENEDLKAKNEELEREIRELRFTSANIGKKQVEKTENKENKDGSGNEMKDYLKNIKNEIQIKNDYFHFDGRNYYIGDKLNGYEVRDIKQNSIRFCSDWCYTLIY